jgi:hypothetical protein
MDFEGIDDLSYNLILRLLRQDNEALTQAPGSSADLQLALRLQNQAISDHQNGVEDESPPLGSDEDIAPDFDESSSHGSHEESDEDIAPDFDESSSHVSDEESDGEEDKVSSDEAPVLPQPAVEALEAVGQDQQHTVSPLLILNDVHACWVIILTYDFRSTKLKRAPPMLLLSALFVWTTSKQKMWPPSPAVRMCIVRNVFRGYSKQQWRINLSFHRNAAVSESSPIQTSWLRKRSRNTRTDWSNTKPATQYTALDKLAGSLSSRRTLLVTVSSVLTVGTKLALRARSLTMPTAIAQRTNNCKNFSSWVIY